VSHPGQPEALLAIAQEPKGVPHLAAPQVQVAITEPERRQLLLLQLIPAQRLLPAMYQA